uniref:Capsid protein n=1 Tax=Nuksystermes virus TaxID=2796622 RepID=A0A894KNR0_9VIRU|nr:hypothetical protein 3 [Nuksystermes virus]
MDIVATPQLNAGESGDVAPIQATSNRETSPATTREIIPRPFGIQDLIRRWQPMGFRVVVNLPFLGDDKSWLFMIKVNPVIPWLGDFINSSTRTHGWMQYFIAANAVSHFNPGTVPAKIPDGTEGSVFITQHSPPPFLSVYSQGFRKWRGSMQYRIRTVASFASQGYIVTGLLKNIPIRTIASRAIDDANYVNWFNNSIPCPANDVTYNDVVLNNYMASDSSMFRHIDVVAPFVYPVDWIDRVMVEQLQLQTTPKTIYYPHGENYIVVGLRGGIDSNSASQIMFEIEYKPGDDFCLSMPYLPPFGYLTPARATTTGWQSLAMNGLTIPNSTYQTDGTGPPVEVAPPPVKSALPKFGSTPERVMSYNLERFMYGTSGSTSFRK